MKKVITILMLLALCLGLCACGGSGESVELPTKPAQSAPQKQPVADGTSGEGQETTESTGETHPWDVEFNEADYDKFEGIRDDGDVITWKENGFSSDTRRQVVYYHNGDIEDTYYYRSWLPSHSYWWGADGSYRESYYLDNGRFEIMDGETASISYGTMVYLKQIDPDGTEYETFYDENGTPTFSSYKEANGSYSEFYYFENGNTSKYFYDNPATGEHIEQEYFENGSPKKYVSDNSEAGTHSEQEYYESGNAKKSVYKDSAAGFSSEQEYHENGNMKQSKSWSAEYTSEQRYDEDGYCTYLYSKDAYNEVELITDESGKLVKYIENGTVYENDAIPDWVASSYNFRG